MSGTGERSASPAWRSELLRVGLAFLIAPGVMSLGGAIFLFGHPAFAGLLAVVAYAIALGIGLPAYLVLRRWGPPTALRSALVGGLIVAVPVAVVLLRQEVPGEGRAFGWVTATQGGRTLAGYVHIGALAATAGCFGAVGGVLFWLIARPARASG